MARSKVVLWGAVCVPLLAAAVFLPMMRSGLPVGIPVALVDHDNSATSRALVRQLDAFPKTDIAYRCATFGEAQRLMERGEVYAIMTIPEGFARDASTGRQPQLGYYTNNAFLINGSLTFQDLKTASVLAAASVGIKLGDAHGETGMQAMQAAQPIVVESHPVGNPSLNYSIYLNNMLLPGVLQLIVLMFTVSAFGSEVKAGNGPGLIELAGGSTPAAVMGKLLPYTILFMSIGLMFMGLLYGICAFPLRNGFWPMALNYLLLILASQGFAMALLAVFRNYRFSVSIACLIGMLSIPLSGFTFPVTAMYGPMQAWSSIVPLRHFFLNYVDQALAGVPLGYSAMHYAALMGFVAVGLGAMPGVGNILRNDTYRP